MKLYEAAELVDRLKSICRAKEKRVVFLLGSPLSAPEAPGKPGVPSVSGVIALIRQRFSDTPNEQQQFDAQLKSGGNSYQNAFEFLVGHRGQDAANSIVQQAVLNARHSNVQTPEFPLLDLSTSECKALEEQADGWGLPIGVRSLGRLISEHPQTFGQTILTTNFDPLIEVSILRHGGSFFRTVLHRDGDLGQTVAPGCHVVHFHGYWYGHDTLHTTRQLEQERPRLKQSLATLMSDSTLVVLGYGGWDDAFTSALAEMALDDSAKPDVIWTFLQQDVDRIKVDARELLQKLGPGLDRGRVTFFGGVDCNNFLPRLREELSEETSGAAVSLAPGISSRIIEVRDVGGSGSRVELRISLQPDPHEQRESDSPPQTDIWVGRDFELATLDRAREPAIVISGIGGQGKSALAAHYIQTSQQSGTFDNWDWRDCKEEGERLHTQIVALIRRLAGPGMDTSQMDIGDLEGSVEIFFQLLDQNRWIFVFDNVDRYVDLSSGQFIAGLDRLLAKVLSRKHRSRFIFTCRPHIQQDSPKVLPLRLSGLLKEEAFELFRQRGVKGPDAEFIGHAFELTAGHPMWINIVALQVTRMQKRLSDVLDDIRRGQGDLPEKMLRSIWATLNDTQLTVLRTLAEMEIPDTKERIAEMMAPMRWNRFDGAVRTLLSLNLIVVRAQDGLNQLLELHPLLRQFIRKNFPTKDRERFISPIVRFLDRVIERFRPQLQGSPAVAILHNWTQKVELDINRGYFESAVKTLAEVAGPLANRGLPEELVRIGVRLFDQIDWPEAHVLYKEFPGVLDKVLKSMIQLGLAGNVERYLQQYEQAIPGKSAEYINLCDLRCYALWFERRYDEAIAWGEEGEALKVRSGVDTKFSTLHNLALARRDSGLVESALDFFLKGQTVEEVVQSPIDPARNGEHYGNIGRCLQFLGKIEEALNVLRKSAILLEDDDSGLNQGYVRLWIGELLQSKGELKLCVLFFRAAVEKWATIAPRRAQDAIQRLLLLGEPRDSSDLNPRVVETGVRRWLNR